MLLGAIHRGEWQRFERGLRGAIAADAARPEPPSDDELRPGVVAFRRARNLLAGEEYRAWLAEHGLTDDDVNAHVRRSLVDVRAAGIAIARRELAATADVELLLSGRLREWAQALAQCAAAARGLQGDAAANAAPAPAAPDVATATLVASAGETAAPGLDELPADDLAARSRRVVELHAALQEFSDRVATVKRLEDCLSAHRLDWQRLRWEQAIFSSEGAAREAALWIRDDGVPLAEVSAQAGATWSDEEAYAEADARIAQEMIGAEPGKLVGPLASNGHWLLLCLHDRVAPARDDPALAARARREVVDDALERYLAGRIEWHGDL